MNEGSATNDLIVIAEFGADLFLSFRYCRPQFGRSGPRIRGSLSG